MNRKKNTTIILFTFSLFILVVLQGYYIYNSYRLEEKELNRQAKTIADQTLEMMEDSESEAKEEKLLGNFEKLRKGICIQKEKITHPEVLYNSESVYNRKLEKLIKKKFGNTDFQIAMKSEMYSVFDEVLQKELLPKNRSIILFQTEKKMDKPLLINESKWSSHQSTTNTDLNLDEKKYYLIKSKSTFQILNLPFLIFKKIIPLIMISLLISVLLLILFRNSIKNLNRQKKKISQLHTTIDSIAHELNTPITTLKFSIVQSDTETKALLERQIKRLENIVSSIHTYDSEDVPITQMEIENYFSDCKKNWDKIDFIINIQYVNNDAFLKKDFIQIMNNLLDNSSKYGSTKIEIALKIDTITEIEISDNGIGIPKDEQHNIFEKYYRITRNENLHVNGLGMGLFLVKKIVDKYKGEIFVASKERGVSFKIRIPNEA